MRYFDSPWELQRFAIPTDIEDRINVIQTQDIDPEMNRGDTLNPSAVLRFLAGITLKPPDDQPIPESIKSLYKGKKWLEQIITDKTLEDKLVGRGVGTTHPFEDVTTIRSAIGQWADFELAPMIPTKTLEDAENGSSVLDLLKKNEEDFMEGAGETLAIMVAGTTRNGDPQTIAANFAGKANRQDIGYIALNSLDCIAGTDQFCQIDPVSLGAKNAYIWKSFVDTDPTHDIRAYNTARGKVRRGSRGPSVWFLHTQAWHYLAGLMGVYLPGSQVVASKDPRFLDYQSFIIAGGTFVADDHVPFDATTDPTKATFTVFGIDPKSIQMRFKVGTNLGWTRGKWNKLPMSGNMGRVDNFSAQIMPIGTRRFHYKCDVKTMPIS